MRVFAFQKKLKERTALFTLALGHAEQKAMTQSHVSL
jgi:hypothetical protein